MKNHFKYLFFSLLAMNCGGSNEQGELIKNATRHGVNTFLGFNTDYEDERVSIDGYVSFPSSTTEETGGLVRMDATSKPMSEGDNLVSLIMKMGDDDNEVSIKMGGAKSAGYKTTEYEVDESQIIITTNDGDEFPLTQKFRISGTVEYAKDYKGNYYETDMFMDKPGSDFPEIKKGLTFKLVDIRIDKID
jgi:hypothetical protein